jgi:hypothetical protein
MKNIFQHRKLSDLIRQDAELETVLLGLCVTLGLCVAVAGYLIPHSPTMTVGMCIFLISIVWVKSILYSMYFEDK